MIDTVPLPEDRPLSSARQGAEALPSTTPDVERVQSPEQREFQDCASSVGKTVQPDWDTDADESKPPTGHEHGALTSVRTVDHRGREIVIRTTYEIEVDGRLYKGHAQVDEDGKIHCHAIPYDTYPSAVDFVKQLIDLYPESFPVADRESEDCHAANGGKRKKA